MANKKYLDLEGLTIYDGKVKGYAESVAESEASSAVSGHDSNINAHSTLLGGYVKTSRQIAGKALTADITSAELTAVLQEATTLLKGLMSASDKEKLNSLWAIFDNGADEDFVDTLTEILEVFQNYPQGVDLIQKLSAKVDKIAGYSLVADSEISKLSGVESGAQKNIQSDWEQTDSAKDDYIKNKPTLPDVEIGISGSGNGIASIAVDSTNKHKLNITKTTFATMNDFAELEIDTIDADDIDYLFE